MTKEPQRVNVVIQNKDTLIQFKLADARIILGDVLEKQRLDTLVEYLEVNDSLKDITLGNAFSVIRDLNAKDSNNIQIIDNMTVITGNKDKEIALKDGIIKEQKKEIRKQKFLKIMGFTAAVVLPIATILLMSH